MYNDSVIQEQSGLNAFFITKSIPLVGIELWDFKPLCPVLMMTVFQDFFVQILTTAPMVYYAAVVVELILVFVASGKAVKNSPSALPIFLIYSALNGFTLSFIIARYMQATVYKGFLGQCLDDVYCHGCYRTRREKRPFWNGTCLDGSLDRCDHRFCCEHVLEKFWHGLYLEYYLCLPLYPGLTAWDNQKSAMSWSNQWSTCDRLGSGHGFGTVS